MSMSGSENEYTLPGVMRFLQLEWQRAERDRIQWDLERAELRSRLSKADADRARLQQQLDTSLLATPRPSVVATEETGLDTAEEARRLAALREYMNQCVAEVNFLLEQNCVPAESQGGMSAAAGPVSGHMPPPPPPPPPQSQPQQVPASDDGAPTGSASAADPAVTEPVAPSLLFSDDFPPTGARKRLLHTLAGVDGGATALAIASNKVAVIGDASGNLVVWDVSAVSGARAAAALGSPQCVPETGLSQARAHEGAVSGVAACDREAYSAGVDGTLAAWELRPGEQLRMLSRTVAHNRPISALAQHPGDNVLVTASEDGAVKFWGTRGITSAGGSANAPVLAPNGALLHTRRYSEAPGVLPTALCYFYSQSPAAWRLLVGFSDGGIVLADGLGNLVRRVRVAPTAAILAPVPPAVRALAVPDTAHVAAGLATGDLALYDLASGELCDEVRLAHRGGVSTLGARPHKQTGLLVSGGRDGLVAIWTCSLGSLSWKGRLLSHDALECGGVAALALARGGAAVAGRDGLVRLYDVGDL